MKRNLLQSILTTVFLLLLGAFLYYLFYKPVEGFFEKTDACDMAKKNQVFIQNQVNDVSANLVNLQTKLNKVGDIRSELQGLLTKYGCLQFNTSNAICINLSSRFTTTDTQLTNALIEKKTQEDKILEANTKIPQLTANITANTGKLTQLTTDPILNCDPKKGTVYLTTDQCKLIVELLRKTQADINTDTTSKTYFTTQLTNSTSNLAKMNSVITDLDTSKKSVQSDLDKNNCTTIKSTFTCSELNGQLKLLEKTIDNAKKDQSYFQSYFTEKSAPLNAINNDLTQYVCP